MNQIGHEILRVVEAAKKKEKYAWKESEIFRNSLERGFFFLIYDVTEGYEYLRVYHRRFLRENPYTELAPALIFEFTEETYKDIQSFEL